MVAPSSAAGFPAEAPVAQAAVAPSEQPVAADWSPGPKEHLIYHWVTMEGKTQSEVASLLEVSQATISRVLRRYERWQAHVQERDGGRLDHAERQRFQRWVTFERNEVILASCLRIAKEMEGFTDLEKRTTSHPLHRPSRESEIRTQHAQIDRSGIAARFLRLAFHVNMQQLKLSELDAPPPADPLSAEELAELALTAKADLAELTRARALSISDDDAVDIAEADIAEADIAEAHIAKAHIAEPAALPIDDDGALTMQPSGEPTAERAPKEPAPASELAEKASGAACHGARQEESAGAAACDAPADFGALVHTMNKMHNGEPAEFAPRRCQETSYGDSPAEEKVFIPGIAAPEPAAFHGAELAAVAGP